MARILSALFGRSSELLTEYHVRVESLDGRHVVVLSPEGEVPRGPAYYHLRIDDRDFGRRVFGEPVVWSPDSAIVALQEWHTPHGERGPTTSLVLIRPGDWTFAAFPAVECGFASPERFVDGTLVLRHSDLHVKGCLATVTLETDLSTIHDWSPLN